MMCPVMNRAFSERRKTHASAMIRATEDLVALTRILKEAWLFGQLGSGFEGVGTEGTDRDAVAVGEKVRGLVVGGSGGGGPSGAAGGV